MSKMWLKKKTCAKSVKEYIKLMNELLEFIKIKRIFRSLEQKTRDVMYKNKTED